jgi:hypothetical protein
MDTDFLDWALADFSGYVAADELYEQHLANLRRKDLLPWLRNGYSIC